MKRGNKNNIKQIPVWKVLLFGIITLGIYPIIWVALRRNEVKASHNILHHWITPIGTLVLGFLLMSAVYLFAPVFTQDMNIAAGITTYGFYAICLSLAVIVAFWMLYNLRAINQKIKLKLPGLIIFIATLFCPTIFIAYEQHSINKKPDEMSFGMAVWITILCVVFGMVYSVGMLITSPVDTEIKSLKAEYESMQRGVHEIDRLTNKYESCLDELDSKYPEDRELSSKEYEEYESASDGCEAIYQKIEEYMYDF